MNTLLLKRIKKEILARPEQFYMGDWATSQKGIGREPTNCGTAACIGGWAWALSNPKNKNADGQYQLDRGANFVSPSDMARVLEIDNNQSMRLFGTYEWPSPFRQAFYDSKPGDFKKQARIAAGRIQHFIDTDGKE